VFNFVLCGNWQAGKKNPNAPPHFAFNLGVPYGARQLPGLRHKAIIPNAAPPQGGPDRRG